MSTFSHSFKYSTLEFIARLIRSLFFPTIPLRASTLYRDAMEHFRNTLILACCSHGDHGVKGTQRDLAVLDIPPLTEHCQKDIIAQILTFYI